MFSRFVTNVVLLLLAGFLAVACFAFGAGTVVWLAFGVGCAAAVVALVDFALPERGLIQRAVDVLAGLLVAWLIVASLTYASRATVKWIAFGEAAMLVGLALIALVAHEVSVIRRLPRVRSHNGDGHARGSFRPEPSPARPVPAGGR